MINMRKGYLIYIMIHAFSVNRFVYTILRHFFSASRVRWSDHMVSQPTGETLRILVDGRDIGGRFHLYAVCGSHDT